MGSGASAYDDTLVGIWAGSVCMRVSLIGPVHRGRVRLHDTRVIRGQALLASAQCMGRIPNTRTEQPGASCLPACACPPLCHTTPTGRPSLQEGANARARAAAAAAAAAAEHPDQVTSPGGTRAPPARQGSGEAAEGPGRAGGAQAADVGGAEGAGAGPKREGGLGGAGGAMGMGGRSTARVTTLRPAIVLAPATGVCAWLCTFHASCRPPAPAPGSI